VHALVETTSEFGTTRTGVGMIAGRSYTERSYTDRSYPEPCGAEVPEYG
jgi:hypothetical protein